MCGLTHVTVAAMCCSSSLLCISNSDWATDNEAGRSVSVTGNEEPRWRDLSPIEFSFNWNYSLITHNKTPVHSNCWLLRVCAACPISRLNRVPSSVALGKTSKIRSPPGPRRIQHEWFSVLQFQASVNAAGSLVVPENLTNFWSAELLNNFQE